MPRQTSVYLRYSILLSLVCVVPVTGCTVAEYEKPVSDFSQAAVDAEAALLGLNNQVTRAYTELQSKRVVRGDVQPRYHKPDAPSPQDCLVQSLRCRLELVDQEARSEGTFPQDPALRNMIVMMTSIRMYAQNLADIVKADTAAKVSASANSTLGSVFSLADSVNKIKNSKQPRDTDVTEAADGKEESIDLDAYKTPVGELVNWFVGNYIASVQFDALKHATATADPVIAEASQVLGKAAEAGADIPKVALAEAVSMRNDAFAEERSVDNLTKLIADAAAFDQFLLAETDGVFARMADGHHALAQNLQSEKPSVAVVAKKIKDFLVEAETLHRIIEEIRSAGEKDGEGEKTE